MIQAAFFEDSNGELQGFKLTGHAAFSESGTDILCAAVSSVAFMTANTITEVLKIAPEKLILRDGEMKLCLYPQDIMECRGILKGLKMHLVELSQQYKDFLNVNVMEVLPC